MSDKSDSNVSAFPLQPREIVGLFQQYLESQKPLPVDPTADEKQVWDGCVMQLISFGKTSGEAIEVANDVIKARRQQFYAKEEGDK